MIATWLFSDVMHVHRSALLNIHIHCWLHFRLRSICLTTCRITLDQAQCQFACIHLCWDLLLAAATRKKLAKAEKKQKAREAALQLPAIAEHKPGPSDTGKVVATSEATPQDSMPAEAATAKLKPKKKKGRQASSSPEQDPALGSGAAHTVGLPVSPTGPSDAILANPPALASSSQHPATLASKSKKGNTVLGAGVAESSSVHDLIGTQPEATPASALTAAHPYAEASSGLANGHHSTQRQPSPVARMRARPYLPPVETHHDPDAGWTVVNGHQRHVDPAAAHTAPADPVSADPCHSDAPWGEQPVEELDQGPEDPEMDKIGLASMEGHFPLRRRGVRAGRRHKKRNGVRDPSADYDSDHAVRGRPVEGQPSQSPLAGQFTARGIPDASNSPVRGISLPPGLPVELNSMQAEQNIRQIRKANALQAAQAAEAAKQGAAQRAHAAAEMRRQADFMAMQQPADDWPALSAAESSSG